jgi:ABC-type amino acid transport substrate-binding protein
LKSNKVTPEHHIDEASREDLLMKLILSLRTRRQNPLTGKSRLVFLVMLMLTSWSTAFAAPLQTSAAASNTNTLTIGYRTDAAPFSYQDAAGKPTGYTVAICEKVVAVMQKEMGDVEVTYLPLTLAERGPALVNSRVDLLCGADTVTLSRRKAVSFSLPIFLGGVGALMRTDAEKSLRKLIEGKEPEFRPRWRASFSDILRQRTLVVVDGSLTQIWLTEAIDEFKITSETIVVDDYAAGVAAVSSGDADVFFGDRPILLAAAENDTNADDLYVADRHFSYETIALTMRRDNDNLRLVVDRTLSNLYRSGGIVDIYSEYFGVPDEETLTLFRINALPD